MASPFLLFRFFFSVITSELQFFSLFNTVDWNVSLYLKKRNTEKLSTDYRVVSLSSHIAPLCLQHCEPINILF